MANVKDRLGVLDKATPPDVWRSVVSRTSEPLHLAEPTSAKRRVLAATLALGVFAGASVLVWQAFRPASSPLMSATPAVHSSTAVDACDSPSDAVKVDAKDLQLHGCAIWQAGTPISLRYVTQDQGIESKLALVPADACTAGGACDDSKVVWEAGDFVAGVGDASYRIGPLDPGRYVLFDRVHPTSARLEIDVR